MEANLVNQCRFVDHEKKLLSQTVMCSTDKTQKNMATDVSFKVF